MIKHDNYFLKKRVYHTVSFGPQGLAGHSARLVYEEHLHFLQDTLELRLLESAAPATAPIAQVVMAKVWPWVALQPK